MSSTYEQQTPMVPAMGVLLFYREADSLGLVAFKSSVQPFANITTNYTCHNRTNKINEQIHMNTPFLLQIGVGNTFIIPQFLANRLFLIYSPKERSYE